MEDKLEEVFSFLPPLTSLTGLDFNPYFSHGPEEDLNSFLAQETDNNIYPLIWLLYPYTEKRNNVNVTAPNIRLIFAIENSNDMLNKQRLQGSYKQALYPLFYNTRDLFSKAQNIQIFENSYELTKFPNYGDTKANFYAKQKSKTTTIWDALAVDFGITINKFCHKLE